ncbi:MAG: hypothetical protein ACFFFB_14530 [Candidatus Heimdallarchaeota archaeon]
MTSISNKIKWNNRLIFVLKIICVFLLVPFVGTLLHELGHYAVAILSGYQAQIHFNYTTSTIPAFSEPLLYFIFILGGPISTWMLCLIPFAILLILYNKNSKREILHNQFLNKGFIVLLFFVSMAGRFIFTAITYIITRSNAIDEYKMADYFNIYPETFLILFLVVSLIILIITIYKIPTNYRLFTILGALSGATVGYLLWNNLIGPLLLP